MFSKTILLTGLIIGYFTCLISAQVNQLTGQPALTIPLLTITNKTGTPFPVFLQYKGEGVEVASRRGNDIAPVSWCGLGWQLSIPTIYVVHNNTVSKDDDVWFYKDANGTTDEIIRVYADSKESFYLKHDPYTKITPYYVTIPNTDFPIITEWELVSKYGVIYRLGDRNQHIYSSTCRRVPCWQNSKMIGAVRVRSPLIAHSYFIYQWDLRELEDPNGGKFNFQYKQVKRSINFIEYCGESYIEKITSDNGQEVQFEIADKEADARRPVDEELVGDFDFFETKKLTKIKKIDLAKTEEVKIEQTASFNTGKQGFQKPLLTEIRSVENYNNNYKFEYATNSLLKKVDYVKTGKSMTYAYWNENINFNQIDSFKISLRSSNFSKSEIYEVGNHIFCIDTGDGSITRLEIIDNASTKLLKASIPSVTGIDLQNIRCYPGPDFFVLIRANKSGNDTISHTIVMFEYIDQRWVRSSGFGSGGAKTLPLIHKTVAYPAWRRVTIFEDERDIVYNYQKVNGIWVSNFNAPGEGNDINVENNHDVEGYGWNLRQYNYLIPTLHGFNAGNRFTLYGNMDWCDIKRWNGYNWTSEQVYNIVNGYNYVGYRNEVYENAYCIFNSGGANSVLKIFRYTLDDRNWNSSGPNFLPNNTKGYFGRNFFITIEPDNWAMIGKYKPYEIEQPDLTYIEPTLSGVEITEMDANHKWGGTSPIPYSKRFDYTIDTIYSNNNYFLALNRSNNFIWLFRKTATGWKSKINWNSQDNIATYEWNHTTSSWDIQTRLSEISAADSKGQGYRFPRPIKNVFLNENNIGIWYVGTSNDSLLAIANYDKFTSDFINGSSEPFNIHLRYPVGGNKKKVKLTDNVIYELCEGDGVNQTLRIINRMRKLNFEGFQMLSWSPTLDVVSSVTERGAFANDIRTEFVYNVAPGANAVYNNEGIVCFNKSKKTIQNGNNGSVINYYECDSLNGLFGALNSTEVRNENGVTVTKTTNNWDTYEIELPNQRLIKVPRLAKNENTVSSVITSTIWPENYFLGDVTNGNGEPEAAYTLLENGNGLVKKTIYAYKSKTSDTHLKEKNMLTQKAGEVIYNVPDLGDIHWKSGNTITVNTTEYFNLGFTSLNLDVGDQIQCHFTIKNSTTRASSFRLQFRVHYTDGTSVLKGGVVGNVSTFSNATLKYKFISADNPGSISGIDLVLQALQDPFDASSFDAQIIMAPNNITQNVHAVTGNATTWEYSNNKCLPKSSYSWVVPITGSDARPVSGYTFQPFNYENITINPNWKRMSTIEQYDVFGATLETKDGKGTSSSVVYRNDLHLPIGTLANSQRDESAVFTCDYTLFEEGFFDKENGWGRFDGELPENGLSYIDNTNPHFGQASLHVKNAKAATKTLSVNSRTAKVIWSAWVRPVSTNPIRFAACLVENGAGNNTVFYDYEYNTLKGLKADGTWQFVKFIIDISKPVGGTLPGTFDGVANENGIDGIYIWVGNHTGHPESEFYIDDIRIYPSKSLVTTTYYDFKWQQPILTVDANGNPSQKVEYDDFGRPVRWYKIDKTDPANPSKMKLLQQKEYHLIGDFTNPDLTKWYKIVAAEDMNFCIEASQATWSDGQDVNLFRYSNATHMQWKFVPAGSGYFNM